MPCYHDRARCHRFFYLYSVWWAHNPQFHRIETWLSCTPRLKKLFLAFDFIWNSRATCPVTYFWYQTQYLFPLPRILFALCFRHRTIACPLETSHNTSLLCSRYFRKSQFESYFRHLPRCYRPDSRPCRGLFSRSAHPLFFRKYDGVFEERMPLHHDDLKQRNEDINVLDRPLQEEQAKMRRPARFVTKPSPLSLPLKSRDEISYSGGELWRPDNQATVTSTNDATSPRLLLLISRQFETFKFKI